jgi:acetoin utilization protein AcuB
VTRDEGNAADGRFPTASIVPADRREGVVSIMKMEDIMTTEVVVVGMDDRLETVQELFETHKFHHLLVVEENAVVGIISDRDLLKALSPFVDTGAERMQDLSTLDKRVHLNMSRNPITAEKETTVQEAAKLLVENNISCLPILSPEKEVAGIVTWKDILRIIVSEE